MEKKKLPPKYTAEFRARCIRLYKDHRVDYASDNTAFNAITPKLGCAFVAAGRNAMLVSVKA